MTAHKEILMIAGPNGAGKTTFAAEYLLNEAGCPDFLNADSLAVGLGSPQASAAAVRAGRLLVEGINSRVAEGKSFALETTLSGRGYARAIPRWKDLGYRVKLLFLRSPKPEVTVARVRQRVSRGGHDIPEPVARRRFCAGLRNFEQVFRGLADEWAAYDNSTIAQTLLEEGLPKEPEGVRPTDEAVSGWDLAGVGAAIGRAARRACWDAAVHGVPIVAYRGGQVSWERVDPQRL